MELLVKEVTENQIDVVILDPLGAMHSLAENVNEAINLLMGVLREIAYRTGAAILLVHHTSKAAGMNMDAHGADASRGASALTDAARNVRQLVPMAPQEANRLGIAEEDRRRFVRVDNGKANLAPADVARWLEMVPVALGNATAEYPNGDHVASVRRWTPPAVPAVTPSDLARVQAAIGALPSKPRASDQSPNWVGHVVARVLGLNIGAPVRTRRPDQAAAHARVRALLREWLAFDALAICNEQDGRAGRGVPCVVVGTPAALLFDDEPEDEDADDRGGDLTDANGGTNDKD